MGLEQYISLTLNKPIIILDKREPAEYEAVLTSMGAKVKRELLPFGDAYIPPKITVEIKRKKDIFSSTYDKRIFSQLSGRQAVLIIENPEVVDQAVYFGLLAFLILEGVPVIITRSKEETAHLLYRLAHQLQVKKGKSPKFLKAKRQYKVGDVAISMLTAVPGIGPKRAEKLIKEFGSLAGVLSAPKIKLKKVVGEKAAEQLWSLLHQSTKAFPSKKA